MRTPGKADKQSVSPSMPHGRADVPNLPAPPSSHASVAPSFSAQARWAHGWRVEPTSEAEPVTRSQGQWRENAVLSRGVWLSTEWAGVQRRPRLL